MKELEKTYNPADIEDRLYQKWFEIRQAERGGWIAEVRSPPHEENAPGDAARFQRCIF